MAYSYDFKDNTVYGADDINAIRASLLTKGVIEETQTSCKVEPDETGVKIMPGQAMFADGCRIEVDEDGASLAVTPSAVNYIYFYNNTLAGVCEIKADTAAPAGDFVLLAIMDEQGNLSDKREFAQLKTADAERYAASFSGSVTIHDDMAVGDVIGEIKLPKSNCSYLEFDYGFGNERSLKLRVFPKENGYVIWQYPYAGQFYFGDTFSSLVFGKTREIKFEVSGDILILRLVSISSPGTESYNISIAGVCMR